MVRHTDDTLRDKVHGESCVYCGRPRACYDHFPPVEAGTLWGWLLPACTECNSILGARDPFCFEKRVERVKARLATKYHHRLAAVQWDADELAEMSPEFQRQITARASVRSEIEDRLDWLPYSYLAVIFGHSVDLSEEAQERRGMTRGVRTSTHPPLTHPDPLPAPATGHLEAIHDTQR